MSLLHVSSSTANTYSQKILEGVCFDWEILRAYDIFGTPLSLNACVLLPSSLLLSFPPTSVVVRKN